MKRRKRSSERMKSPRGAHLDLHSLPRPRACELVHVDAEEVGECGGDLVREVVSRRHLRTPALHRSTVQQIPLHDPCTW